MKIITISGIDGSGKSTQVKLLKEYLESQGKRVFYFHAIEFGMARKIVEFRNKYCLLCRLTRKCKTGYQEKSVTKANWLQVQLRKLFFKIDVQRFQRFIQDIENNYDYLLTDRYFYDSVVNIEYLSKKDYIVASIWEPDLAIYLKVEPEIIIQRKRKPDQGLEYLKEKSKIFESKISIWNLKVIDASQKKDKISEEIKTYVAKLS